MAHDVAPERVLSDRHILPRWRRPSEATEEMQGTSAARKVPFTHRDGWIDRLRDQYLCNPTVQAATELKETAFILGCDLLAEDKSIVEQSILQRLGSNSLPLDPVQSAGVDRRAAIRILRARLSAFPNQPLAWTELARQYLASGSELKADSAMSCALQLSPNNRYVLRSAVRFYSRSDEGLERALWLLRKSPRTARDPWLLSAEIASSDKAEQPSPFVKLAKSMLENKRAEPRHYSELAAAVGTLEHQFGRHKRAKQLMAQALIDPTGNSVAQAVYLSQSDRPIVVPVKIELSGQDYEASTRSHYAKGEFDLALGAAFSWLDDEPFDVKPALLGSFLSFDVSLAEGAERIATLGLESSPHHSSLHNNRAVARAYLGDLRGAFEDINNSNKEGREEPSHLATLGLLAYRMGHNDFGRDCYTRAVAWFSALGDVASCYRACLYWSKERARIGDAAVGADVDFLKGRINKLPHSKQESDLFALIKAVEIEMGQAQATPLWNENSAEVPAELALVGSSFKLPDVARQKALAFSSQVQPLVAD